MRSRVLLGLWAGSLLLCCAQARADIIILPPDGTTMKVPTPLARGPVYVRDQGGWVMLPPVTEGTQRILRQVYEAGHEVLRGRSEWITIDKSGTATVRLRTVAAAEGESFTIRIACDVEEMPRGTNAGTLYRDARIELTVVADLRKHLGDLFLAPGDEVSVPVPSTIHVRRVSSVMERVAGADHQGANMVIAAKKAGKTKVTLNYWIGDDVDERFSREIDVEVSDPRLEYVCTLEPGASRSVTHREVGETLARALPTEDGKVVRVVRWEGPQQASLEIEPTSLRVSAGGNGRSTAIVVFRGQKRNRGFEAWLRFTIAVGQEGAAAAPAAPEAPAPPGEPAGGEGTPGPDDAGPAQPLRVLSQFGAAVGQDYVATANIQNDSAGPLELKVTIRFKDRAGRDLGEQVAAGPKSLAPGKRGAFRTTLVGGGAVIESLEVVVEVLGPKAE